MRRLLSTSTKPVLSRTIRLHDVTPRDGLQNEAKILSIPARAELVKHIAQTGAASIEIASFVRADAVPAMAGASELVERLANEPAITNAKMKQGLSLAALIPNKKGLETLLKVNKDKTVDTVVVLVSCTDTHSKANVNRPMKDALVATLDVIAAAKKEGLAVRAYASLAFGCPFEGKVPEEVVERICAEYWAAGADKVILADTLGCGKPEQVTSLVGKTKSPLNNSIVGLHLHDSHGLAHLNVEAGLESGVEDFDAAIGGAGGCNFAPGSKGNISVEKLMATCANRGLQTNLNREKILYINAELSLQLGRALTG